MNTFDSCTLNHLLSSSCGSVHTPNTRIGYEININHILMECCMTSLVFPTFTTDVCVGIAVISRL